LDSFRAITSQLYVNGNATQARIAQAFGIKEQALKRWVKRYRNQGSKTFYQPRKTRGKATVLIPEVREKAQIRLDQGLSLSGISKELGISYDVLRKAVGDGRLTKPKKRLRRWPSRAVKAGRRAIWLLAAILTHRAISKGRHHQEPTQCRGRPSSLGHRHHQCRGTRPGQSGENACGRSHPVRVL
jgi:transposase